MKGWPSGVLLHICFDDKLFEEEMKLTKSLIMNSLNSQHKEVCKV